MVADTYGVYTNGYVGNPKNNDPAIVIKSCTACCSFTSREHFLIFFYFFVSSIWQNNVYKYCNSYG